MKRSFECRMVVMAALSFFCVLGVTAFAGTASAQLTILPQAAKDADCKNVIDEFEKTGKMPSASDVKQGQDQSVQNNQAVDQANKAYEAAVKEKEAADKALADKSAEASICEKWISDPMTPTSGANCGNYASLKDAAEKAATALTAAEKGIEDANKNLESSTKTNAAYESMRGNLLGCAIKTGRISLSMIPYFITYFINYLLSLVGIVSVMFIVLGGYFYIWGGLTEKKDKGKQYITHALMGLGIASLAWILVNAVMAIFTS